MSDGDSSLNIAQEAVRVLSKKDSFSHLKVKKSISSQALLVNRNTIKSQHLLDKHTDSIQLEKDPLNFDDPFKRKTGAVFFCKSNSQTKMDVSRNINEEIISNSNTLN